MKKLTLDIKLIRMTKGASIIILSLVILATGCSPRKLKVYSPDKNLMIEIIPGENNAIATFTLNAGNKKILLPSSLFLNMDGTDPAGSIDLINYETETVENNWTNKFGEKKNIPDYYNQMKLYLTTNGLNINLIVRAYNEGMAIAYELPEHKSRDSITITDENILFRFPDDHQSWSAPRAQAIYRRVPLSSIDKGCERPLVIESDASLMIAIGEAKLEDYPRMKFDPDSSGGITIKSRLDGPAKKSIPFQSPWRVILAGKDPGDLLEKNYLFLNLNDPSKIEDESWIKPGKALREVTLTTEGGKAAVDFTSSHNMQYIEFDAGWYGPENKDESDARAVNLDPARSKGPLDLQEVIKYADSKGIGVLLYVNRKALERQIDSLLPIYRDWGVAGIKFGFVQVGNQKVTAWLHESVKKAAAYGMVVDVHDEYRPTGFSRTYPNFLTQEGIRGDEESPANSHTLITMFTRMLAGAGDNTICYYNERVDKKMGSHASQLAKAVCIFSPLQFLYWYDRAANIGNEPELEFFNNVPTVWDETIVLQGKIGEYGVIARKSGNDWFIGCINGTEARTLELDFGFLDPDKEYSARIYSDDPSVNTVTHVRVDSMVTDTKTIYKANLRSNNGIAIQLRQID